MANNDFYTRYMQVKRQYGNALVFYRLGDFYEVLGADAQTVSKVLDLTLVTRAISDTERVPMCDFPYHSTERYIQQLTQKGYRVAVAETT